MASTLSKTTRFKCRILQVVTHIDKFIDTRTSVEPACVSFWARWLEVYSGSGFLVARDFGRPVFSLILVWLSNFKTVVGDFS